LAKHPFTVGTRPQLIVVSGLSVGIPLTVGFRPQLVVVSGLFSGNPFDGGILGFYGAFGYHETLSQTFLSHNETLAIKEPFMTFSFFTMESCLS
jgi:hypothetical protein